VIAYITKEFNGYCYHSVHVITVSLYHIKWLLLWYIFHGQLTIKRWSNLTILTLFVLSYQSQMVKRSIKSFLQIYFQNDFLKIPSCQDSWLKSWSVYLSVKFEVVLWESKNCLASISPFWIVLPLFFFPGTSDSQTTQFVAITIFKTL